MRTMQADRQPLSATDPRDDWLADANDLDWFSDDDETGESNRPRLARARGARRPRSGTPLVERSLQQRRLVAFGALFALIVIAVVVVVMSSGGGGGTKAPTTPTTTATTTPAKTSTKTSTGTKKPPTKTATVTVTLPKSGAIKNGDTGAAVVTLQRALTRLGATGIKADGKFGAKTQSAVTAFQTEHKLTADGVVGAKTAAAINTALAGLGG